MMKISYRNNNFILVHIGEYVWRIEYIDPVTDKKILWETRLEKDMNITDIQEAFNSIIDQTLVDKGIKKVLKGNVKGDLLCDYCGKNLRIFKEVKNYEQVYFVLHNCKRV